MSTAEQPSHSLQEEEDHAGQIDATHVGKPEYTPFQELVERHPDGLLILGHEKTITYANAAACRLLKQDARSLINACIASLVHPGDAEMLAERLDSLHEEATAVIHCTLRFQLGAGAWGWTECAGRLLPMETSGAVVLVLRDLGWRQEQLEWLTQLAFTDPVTGLANRTLLIQRLEHRLRLRDLHQRPIGILSLDLDGFKRVNDTFGHATGDELLRQFGTRLRESVREADTVARLGGDEFVVLLEEVFQIGDITACAERLLGQLGSPLHIDGREILVSASMGLVLANSSETAAEELLDYGDLALYRAKAAGKSRYAVFDKPARAEVRERSILQADLREAVRNGDLCLLYQPEFDLETGRITSVEALLRWKHPSRGLVAASDLLPLVKQAALGREIRQWVFREACRQARAWSAMGGSHAQVRLTVNVSEDDLQSEELPSELVRCLHEAGLPSSRLVLECPEAVLIEYTELAMRRLQMLRTLGVGLAIDSFGARFGSLRLLECLPIQTIKIDREVVHEASTGGPMLKAICSIARDLRISVTAKCIETPSQHRAVLRARCNSGQGYLFCSPLSGEEMTTLLTVSPGLAWVRGEEQSVGDDLGTVRGEPDLG